jgi:ABC-2 type transport system permease protein
MSLLILKLRILKNFILSSIHREKFKVTFILIILTSLLVIAYFIFYKGLQILDNLPLGEVITKNILSLLFLVIFIMLLFSNLIISFSTLYSQRELSLLKVLPIPILKIFFYLLGDTLFLSSWAFVILSLPLILAYGRFYSANSLTYIFILLGLIFFLTISCSLACLVILGLASIFELKKRHILGLIVIFSIIILLIFSLKFKDILRVETSGLFVFLFKFLKRIDFSQATYLPSYWFTKLMIASSKNQKSILFYFSFVLINAIFLLFILSEVAKRWYTRGVFKLIESKSVFQAKEAYRTLKKFIINYLIAKDLIIFLRTPSFWVQTILFFGLLAIYIFNLKNYPQFLPFDYQRQTVVILNLLACGLISSTLSLRFLYPLFSQELTKLWICKLNTLLKRLIYEKLILGILLLLPLSLILMWITNIFLDMEFRIILYTLLVVSCLSLGLVFLGICLGVIYPNPWADPAKMPASFGGVLTSVSSLLYVFITVVLFSLGIIHNQQILYSFAILIESLGVSWFILFLTFKTLKRIEV